MWAVMFFGPLAHLRALLAGCCLSTYGQGATVTLRPARFLKPSANKAADITPAQS
jgi:hypothetical protein